MTAFTSASQAPASADNGNIPEQFPLLAESAEICVTLSTGNFRPEAVIALSGTVRYEKIGGG